MTTTMTMSMTNGGHSTETASLLARRKTNESLATEPRSPRAVIYTRVASKTQADETAVERQLDECRAMAERLGCDVKKVFTDVGVAGTPHRRPGLAALFAFVAAKPVDFMICADTDRVSKNRSILVDAVLRLDAHGTRTAFARTNTLMEVHYDKEETSDVD